MYLKVPQAAQSQVEHCKVAFSPVLIAATPQKIRHYAQACIMQCYVWQRIPILYWQSTSPMILHHTYVSQQSPTKYRRRAKIVETHYVQQVAQDGSSQGSSVKSSNVANPVAAVTQPALLPREAGADYDSLAATGSSFESLAAATTDPQPADVVGSRLMEQPVRLERPVQPGLEHVDQDPSRYASGLNSVEDVCKYTQSRPAQQS